MAPKIFPNRNSSPFITLEISAGDDLGTAIGIRSSFRTGVGSIAFSSFCMYSCGKSPFWQDVGRRDYSEVYHIKCFPRI